MKDRGATCHAAVSVPMGSHLKMGRRIARSHPGCSRKRDSIRNKATTTARAVMSARGGAEVNQLPELMSGIAGLPTDDVASTTPRAIAATAATAVSIMRKARTMMSTPPIACERYSDTQATHTRRSQAEYSRITKYQYCLANN